MSGTPPRIVIVGGGFGGLEVAKGLKRAPAQVTLIDRRNFHLFQPLLYQVATGGLSPGDICSPLRSVLKEHRRAQVLLAEVTGIDLAGRCLTLDHGDRVPYDTLVLSCGTTHDYFGHESWRTLAPGLKGIEDALDIRSRIFLAFETAERETDETRRRGWLTFTVVGGGPTGVELAGALGEIAHDTLKKDFRRIIPGEARILLIEGKDRVLGTYPPTLSTRAESALKRLGVTVITSALVSDITDHSVTYQCADQVETVECRTVLWSAGVRASSLGRRMLGDDSPLLDRAGRIRVTPQLSLPDHPEVFIIGDLALAMDAKGNQLPGLAPVAMQEGRYVARLLRKRLAGDFHDQPFRYRDKGTMATIGRAAAVADIAGLRLWGYPAWIVWLFLHLMYIVEFENRLLILVQWAWNYVTRNRGARLITGEHRLPERH